MSPPFWYFTSALPRALHAAFPLAFLGAVLDRRARPALLIALGFVALYSNLGHKELRFLFPALPLLNLSAAAALSKLYTARIASYLRKLFFVGAVAAVLAGTATAALGTVASVHNYPGGHAIAALHNIGAKDAARAASLGRNLSVHISVLPAMTGVSRFGEAGAPWTYSKEEGLSSKQLRRLGFDYLMSSEPAMPGFSQVGLVDGFAGLELVGRRPAAMLAALMRGESPVRVKTAPAVYIHRRGSM